MIISGGNYLSVFFDIFRVGVRDVVLLTFIFIFITLLPPEGEEQETLVASTEEQSQQDTKGLVKLKWIVCVGCGL